MQRWSKSQYPSRTLKGKFLFILFTVVLISISPQVFAQEAKLDGWITEEQREMMLNTGVAIEQQKIIFEVGRYEDIRVKHVIEAGMWSFDRPRILEILPGMHSNLSVLDDEGSRMNFSFDGETFEESKHVFLNQKLGCCDLVVEYDLDNFMELEDGLWKKKLEFTFDVMVMIEDDIDMIFINSRPADMIDAKGINCVGCFMTLEYFNDKNSSTKEILFNEKKFSIEVSSNKQVSSMEFIGGGAQLLNFGVESGDQIFVLKIPLELMLNPFEVYFTEKDDSDLDQLDKIRKTEFFQDESYVGLSFRNTDEGIISIVGATQEEHDNRLEQIEKRKAQEVTSDIKEDQKGGVKLPLPGQTIEENKVDNTISESETPGLSFEDELDKGQQVESQDYSIIIIISGIVAAIIIGIIIKLKKN